MGKSRKKGSRSPNKAKKEQQQPVVTQTTSATKKKKAIITEEETKNKLISIDISEKNSRQESLTKKLENRSGHKDLVHDGIMKASSRVSPRLHAKVQALENKQSKDNLSRKLGDRPNAASLESENIIKHSSVAPSLRRKSTELEKAIKKDKISHELETRPDKIDLELSGVLKTSAIAPALQATAEKLKLSLTKDEIGHLLDVRPTINELSSAGIIDSRIAPKLQSAAKDLERSMTKNSLLHSLEGRPDVKDLVAANILKEPKLANNIQSAASKLEKEMKKDSIVRMLETRPDYEDLLQSGVVKLDSEAVSAPLQAKSIELKKNLLKSQLNMKLRRRPSKVELQSQLPNIFDANASSSAYEGSSNSTADSIHHHNRGFDDVSMWRMRYATALKAASKLESTGHIDKVEKGALKELILDHDTRVFAAIEVFELDQDAAEMLDTLYRIAKHAGSNTAATN